MCFLCFIKKKKGQASHCWFSPPSPRFTFLLAPPQVRDEWVRFPPGTLLVISFSPLLLHLQQCWVHTLVLYQLSRPAIVLGVLLKLQLLGGRFSWKVLGRTWRLGWLSRFWYSSCRSRWSCFAGWWGLGSRKVTAFQNFTLKNQHHKSWAFKGLLKLKNVLQKKKY